MTTYEISINIHGVEIYVFWVNYRAIEAGTEVTLDEFINDLILNAKVRAGVRGLYGEFITLIKGLFKDSNIVTASDSQLIWQLGQMGYIKAELVQELVDLLPIMQNAEKVEDETIYSNLVRIMEDVEECYVSIIVLKGQGMGDKRPYK
ncbi:MAG: hypothetical protein JRN37_02360 [Nitrososphaerota archaeon]|nr:hypothetical protein [Nitrososphaerota archaeon]